MNGGIETFDFQNRESVLIQVHVFISTKMIYILLCIRMHNFLLHLFYYAFFSWSRYFSWTRYVIFRALHSYLPLICIVKSPFMYSCAKICILPYFYHLLQSFKLKIIEISSFLLKNVCFSSCLKTVDISLVIYFNKLAIVCWNTTKELNFWTYM